MLFISLLSIIYIWKIHFIGIRIGMTQTVINSSLVLLSDGSAPPVAQALDSAHKQHHLLRKVNDKWFLLVCHPSTAVPSDPLPQCLFGKYNHSLWKMHGSIAVYPPCVCLLALCSFLSPHCLPCSCSSNCRIERKITWNDGLSYTYDSWDNAR